MQDRRERGKQLLINNRAMKARARSQSEHDCPDIQSVPPGRRAIEGMLKKSFQSYGLMNVDDGYADGTAEKAWQYGERIVHLKA